MKISVDDKELFSLTETQKNVIKNDINSDIFDADMKRRVEYALKHKYEQCYKRLKAHWEPILIAEGAESIPVQPDAFAEAIFARQDYKDRKAKDEAIAVEI